MRRLNWFFYFKTVVSNLFDRYIDVFYINFSNILYISISFSCFSWAIILGLLHTRGMWVRYLKNLIDKSSVYFFNLIFLMFGDQDEVSIRWKLDKYFSILFQTQTRSYAYACMFSYTIIQICNSSTLLEKFKNVPGNFWVTNVHKFYQ